MDAVASRAKATAPGAMSSTPDTISSSQEIRTGARRVSAHMTYRLLTLVALALALLGLLSACGGSGGGY
jgi:hypothetical protein